MSQIEELAEGIEAEVEERAFSYTVREDALNSASHFFGLALSILGLILMIVRAAEYGTATNVVACAIFGASLISMYGASGIYHGVRSPRLKSKLRVLDHMNIFFLISGTYTPIALIALHGPIGWTIFGVMWGVTLFGFIYKMFFFGASWISSILYVLMGWFAILFIGQIINAIPSECFMYILLGGLFYTSGVVFYMLDEVKEFTHFIWHLFVMLGSIFHFFAIYIYLADMPVK